MRTRDILQLAMSSVVVYISCYLTFQEEYSFRVYKYLADEVFPWVICSTSVVKLCLAVSYVFYGKLPTLPGISSTYIGTAVDVLACFVSLIRINFRYFCLAIFPFLAISFICVLWMRDISGGSGSGTDNNGKTRRMARKQHSGKKARGVINIVELLRDGLKTRVLPEGFNMALLIAPHFLLSLFGMVGDPDHDGNTYDISNLCLFLTCMLQQLTLIMMRLPDTISRATAPASELLYKASLVVLLLTAHIMAINAFGKKVLLLLLPEIVPPLLWFSLHLDRRSPIINVQKIMDSEYFLLKPVLVALCGYIIMVVSKDGLFISRLNWASMSCFVSGLMTYILLLTLRLWPEQVGMATLSSEEVLNLLTFWGKVLLQATVGLLAFAVVACVSKGNSWFLTVFSQ